MFPNLQLLNKVSKEIMLVPNRKKESKRRVHYCCFLLCHKSGLRISEATSFDLMNKTKKGLYRIEKPKGKKERFVYIPKKVIRELRKNRWQPNQTNRHNFYHFLKKVKQELGISQSIELTPHTLRRSFATYQAESGMPLPILQKLLGHSSIRTTALYWQNIYQEPNNDTGSILTAKNWLERKNSPKPFSTENFPEVLETPEPIFIDQSPVISHKNPTGENNSLSVSKTLKKSLWISTSEVSPKNQEEFSLNTANQKSDQLKISQPLAITDNEEQKPTKKELILLQKINLLENQLAQIQAQNKHLKSENKHLKALINHNQEQNQSQIVQLPFAK